MARFIMIVVLSGMVTFGISNITQNSTINQGTQNVVDSFSANRAHDIAGSMSDILLMRIANDVEYRVETEVSEPLFGGEVTYIVEDAFFEGDSLVRITVAAEFNGVTKNVITYTQKPTDGWIPPVIRGAWTANGPLNNTISDMYIDGRDHDLDLNIIPNTGVHGVSTSTDFVNVENAEIGGTNNKVDYPMTFPENPAVIEENYDWGGTFPETPDEILGWPEGTLKAAALSGEFGSQYRLDPPMDGKYIAGLTYPLSGITYIEMTNSDPVELMLEQNGNGGIVVVHGVGMANVTPKVVKGDISITPQSAVYPGATVTFVASHPLLACNKFDESATIEIDADKWTSSGTMNDCNFDVTIPCDANKLLIKIKIPKDEYPQLNDDAEGEVEWAFEEENCDSDEFGSRIKSVKYDDDNSDGLFTGLMIFDYSFHHHIDILGAVIMLSPDLETEDNCNGNQDHWLKYSSEVIENSTKIAAEITGLMGTTGYGFGKKRLDVRYVYE